MRIGIDYLPATTHAPGAGRYARELVRALVRLEDCPELSLFDVGRAPRAIEARALGLAARDPRVRRLTLGLPRRALPPLAALGVDAPRLLGGVDLFHHVRPPGPPVRRALQSMALAELPDPRSAAGSALAGRAPRVDAWIVFSSAWRERVAERLRVPLERVHVTPVGCEHWARERPPPPGPAGPPRILVLGATHAQRAPLVVLRAFELLRGRGIEARLCFAGRRGDAERALDAARAASAWAAAVERSADPREADMAALVGGASVLVHLDPDAGTPVTPLEALASGLAVVASRTDGFREALEGAAEFVGEDGAAPDPDELAAAIEAALASRADPAAAARRAARAARYSWEACARATLAVWRRAVDAGPPGLRAVQ